MRYYCTCYYTVILLHLSMLSVTYVFCHAGCHEILVCRFCMKFDNTLIKYIFLIEFFEIPCVHTKIYHRKYIVTRLYIYIYVFLKYLKRFYIKKICTRLLSKIRKEYMQ